MNETNHTILCRAVDLGVIPYRVAWDLQKRQVEQLQRGRGNEVFYLLEHPHVFTLGRNATGDALLTDRQSIKDLGVEIVETDRGGDVTYHGPGQLVGYPIISLEPRRRDIRRYVNDLEETLIRTLSEFGIQSQRHPVHRGVWTGGRKIASLGIRISRWVTSHGFALNVGTDLSFYSLMIPCGIEGCEMTTMAQELGEAPDMTDVKSSVIAHFSRVYGRRVSFEITETILRG
ncbi:MAG: lipoyl(octanoyl) transferase LipB [Candidatus Krumholzibacteria bacterium]|nr:lipoyl(octanoyl) transferase LipB [Candidatus Krumholzibacteria bacterium]